ncbi:UDP-glycosyltransferase 79B30-like [Silene latifolia]|uniref:UDP-glycosyltransferase 79B30-like n=1 Tax=Silene latifolia TaxID=37657 RepID=UPI003D76DE9A
MQLHLAMYPLLAMGHITPYLHLANKLAMEGHKISLFLPNKTQINLVSHNCHPDYITFIPITIPHVDGLPPGAETTKDIPVSSMPKLLQAMDLTRDTIDAYLGNLKPDIVVLDTPEWLPGLARKHGAKPIYFATLPLAMFAYCSLSARNLPQNHPITVDDFSSPPPGFPSPNIRLYPHEAKSIVGIFTRPIGNGMTFLQKLNIAIEQCDAIMFKSFREIEGIYCDFVEKSFNKPVLLVGPVIPEPQNSNLNDLFDSWLNGFSQGSVVYCALGSECVLEKDQFQELVLGLELTGRPFLAALKPPKGYETIDSALPQGFEERTKGRGMVYGGWVQQQLILQHPSVGCFVTHCGLGSLLEGLVSKCQLVFMPRAVDQFVNARVMSLELRVGVEVEKDDRDDGFVARESIEKAVELMMDEDSQLGGEVRGNHAHWRDFLLMEGLEKSYIDRLIASLQELLC